MTANTPQGMPALQGTRTPSGMYWSAAEAARQCRVSRATIDRAIKAGKLAAEKDAEGLWRISPHALIEAGLKPGKPSPPDTMPVEGRDELDLRAEVIQLKADARVSGIRNVYCVSLWNVSGTVWPVSGTRTCGNSKRRPCRN